VADGVIDDASSSALKTYSSDKINADFATKTGTETLTNKTVTGYGLGEKTVTGTTPVLSITGGNLQSWTLTANSTPTESFSNGDIICLQITDGTDYTIDWSSVVGEWKTDGGSAPALNETTITPIVFWKSNDVVYGAKVGDA